MKKLKLFYYVTRIVVIVLTLIVAMIVMWYCAITKPIDNSVIKSLMVIGMMISGIALQNTCEIMYKSLKEDLNKN